MVDVQVVASQPDPKQFTAVQMSGKMQEHLLGFLNTNNKKGFIQDDLGRDVAILPVSIKLIEALDINTIGELMMILATKQYVEHKQFKAFATKLKEVAWLSVGKDFRLGHAYHILSRMFGYPSHSTLVFHLKRLKTTTVKNYRDVNSINMKIFAEAHYTQPQQLIEVHQELRVKRKAVNPNKAG